MVQWWQSVGSQSASKICGTTSQWANLACAAVGPSATHGEE